MSVSFVGFCVYVATVCDVVVVGRLRVGCGVMVVVFTTRRAGGVGEGEGHTNVWREFWTRVRDFPRLKAKRSYKRAGSCD